jgi:succinate dehydrogenase / fumarate reductase cytochrome b subunit
MNRLTSLYKTTIGKKFIAAITGLILFGFLVGHVAGNLKVFTGNGANGVPHIDEYGQFLKEIGEPLLPYMAGLWIARIVLLGSLVLHVWVVTQLALASAEARPINYVRSKKSAATLPALWMMFSGIVILGFIIFHILHFTTGNIQLGKFEHGYIYNNLSASFAKPLVSLGYVAVMIVIGFHLFHGVWSLFQTLGIDNPDRNRGLRTFAIIAAVVLVVGFSAVPLAFLAGVLPNAVEYAHDLLTGH